MNSNSQVKPFNLLFLKKFIVSLICLMTSSFSLAKNPSWELNISQNFADLNYSDSIVDFNIDKNSPSVSLTYQQSNLLRFSIFYRQNIDVDATVFNQCVPTESTGCLAFFSTEEKVSFSDFGFNWQPVYEISNMLDIYGKLGISIYDIDIPSISTSVDDTVLMYGVGVSYHLSENISLTAGYDVEDDFSFPNVGFSWIF